MLATEATLSQEAEIHRHLLAEKIYSVSKTP